MWGKTSENAVDAFQKDELESWIGWNRGEALAEGRKKMLLEGKTANVSTGDKMKGCFTLIADRTEWTRMYVAAMHHNTNWKKAMNPFDEERMTKCLFQAYSLETIPVDVIGVGPGVGRGDVLTESSRR